MASVLQKPSASVSRFDRCVANVVGVWQVHGGQERAFEKFFKFEAINPIQVNLRHLQASRAGPLSLRHHLACTERRSNGWCFGRPLRMLDRSFGRRALDSRHRRSGRSHW